MYCRFCGKKISEDAVFCNYCGNKLATHSNTAPTAIIDETILINNGKPSKNKRKILRAFALILLFAVVFLFIWSAFLEKSSKKTPSEMKTSDYVWNEIPSYILNRQQAQVDEYFESQKKEQSDIEGWTKYDKYEYGLKTEDGSDTDNDGLTDKEEIEEYRTDPLKCSTAEDLYTDGYKVQHGMDLFTPVKYDGDEEITDENGAIKLFAKTPWDLSATIVDVTEEYRKEDCNLLEKLPEDFYYAYKVCAYDNDIIEVDLGFFAEDLGKQADDLDVETCSSKNNSYYTSRNGSKITIKYEDVNPFDTGTGMKSYDIFIVDKKSMSSQIPIVSNLINAGGLILDKVANANYTGIVCIIPESDVGDLVEKKTKEDGMDPDLGKIGHRTLFLLGAYDATEEEKNALLAAGEYIYYLNYGEEVHLTGDDISYFSKEEVRRRFNNYKKTERNGWCKSLSPQFDGDWPEIDSQNGFFYYWTSSDYLKNDIIKASVKNREFEEHEPDFCIKDEFSFNNLTSDIFADVVDNKPVVHGVCAGMAQITAEVYNSEDNCVQRPKDEVDCQTEYNGSVITNSESYDITQYDGMSTFFNRYLNDFNLNSEEEKNEFMKMVSCYWARSNMLMRNNIDYRGDLLLNSKDNNYLDWETINRATEYLDDYQILLFTCCIENISEGAHCVNLVSYSRGTDIGNDGKEYETVTFDVYDSNYPSGYLKLVCYKIELNDGRNTVYYKYNPCCEGEAFGYYASFLGDRYDYNPQNEKVIPKRCEFGIFNDQGQCLNIKL